MQAYTNVKPVFYTYTDTPVGRMLLMAKAEKLMGIYLVAQQRLLTIERHWKYRDHIACFESLKQQLLEYFKGVRTRFRVAYTVEGTPFQKATWEQLRNIPHGEQISYQALAQLASFPHAVRAVATAVGCNPLLILWPCHRVVRRNGKLGGFAAGTPIKQQLLDLEKCTRSISRFSIGAAQSTGPRWAVRSVVVEAGIEPATNIADTPPYKRKTPPSPQTLNFTGE
jgi:methylated-DNA-[protein]-cysteine S-methyltransferase